MPGQTKKAIRSFRVKDLMITVIPRRSGSGGASIPVDDGPPLPPHISPIAMTALVARKIQAFQKLAIQPELLELAVMDRFAQEIGWDVIGSAMRCLPEAPTCRAMPRASHLARLDFDNVLTLDRLVSVKADLELAIAEIGKLEDERLAQARRNRGDLVQSLQDAIEELQVGGKP